MNWLLLGAVLGCAGFVQGLSGFGFGLVSMSLLPLFMGIKEAAVISTFYSLLATITTFLRHAREYNWKLGAPFIGAVVCGLPFGVYFLEKGSEHLLLRVLGALMMLYAAREFLFQGSGREFPERLAIPLGLFSGAMSGAFNLGGVPSAAYAYAHSWSKGQIMAFLQVMITLSCLLRIVFYHQAGLLGDIPWGKAAVLLVPLYASIWAGHWLLEHSEPAHQRRAIFTFIAISGCYYLFLRR